MTNFPGTFRYQRREYSVSVLPGNHFAVFLQNPRSEDWQFFAGGRYEISWLDGTGFIWWDEDEGTPERFSELAFEALADAYRWLGKGC